MDSDEKILDKLRPLLTDLKSPISTQKAISNNIDRINELKEYGIPNEYIIKLILNNDDTKDITAAHFATMLWRANKQKTKSKIVEKSEPVKINETKQSTPTETSEWNSIGVENNRLIDDLIEFGLTPTDVKEWGCANDIIRRKKLTELVAKQNKAR